MEHSHEIVEEMEMSIESQEEHQRNEEIAEELFKEAEILIKKRKEHESKVDAMISSGSFKRSDRKKLDREGRKLRKKLNSVEQRLEFLRLKNIKEIIGEVENHGQVNG